MKKTHLIPLQAVNAYVMFCELCSETRRSERLGPIYSLRMHIGCSH